LNTKIETAKTDLTHHIGHDLLGPVVQRWLLGLHQYISYFDDDQTAFLFCARAGVRIEKLYRTFLDGFNGASPQTDIFWTSRISTCKGTFNRVKQHSAAIISREYYHHPIKDLIAGIFRNQPELLSQLDLGREEYKAHGHVFSGWIEGSTPAAKEMREYFRRCSAELDVYISNLLRGRSRAVLIDSGWQGSTQSLLSKAYPETAWRGLYFGRSLLPGYDASIVNQVIGLLFESDDYKPEIPETAIVRHRHIVETLLEPNGPSVEEIPGGTCDIAAKRAIEANLNEVVTEESDPLYLAVVSYLNGAGRGTSISEIISRHQIAMAELARVIITPTRKEARSLYCKDRSADFGKNLSVSVLIEPDKTVSVDQRIKRALWQEGQAALEYEGGYLRDTQLRLAGCANSSSYFDPAHVQAAPETEGPTVAIITRTKNRPILLQRAAESVASQTYSKYLWVIVNDGGDEALVRKVVNDSRVDRRKIILVSNPQSLGMEAASNAGIANCESDLIVIHDDDDSWDPTFLKETTAFLSGKAGQRYGGVITHSTYVSEEVRGTEVIQHDRRPYMDWVRNIQLPEMAVGNMFAPISFVFRRSIWEDIGGYNELLPVLGDWYFNLEFLLRTDIGVIPKALANYHHRDRGDSSAYANSVIGGLSKHEEFAAVARNAFIRRNGNKFPGAVAVVSGYFAGDIRHRTATDHPEALPVNHDLADKYWAIAHLNNPPGAKWYSKKRYMQKAIDLNSTWIEMEQIARRTRGFIPVAPTFDEDAYRRQNPDVDAAVRAGFFTSGYSHYILHGKSEGRPRPSF